MGELGTPYYYLVDTGSSRAICPGLLEHGFTAVVAAAAFVGALPAALGDGSAFGQHGQHLPQVLSVLQRA